MTTLDDAKNYSSTMVGVGTQLALTTAISVFSFGAFEVHRRWSLTKHLYTNRCNLEKNPTPLPSTTPFGWVWTTLNLNEEFYLSHVGLDAAMYIRYLKMAFQLMLFSSIIIGAIILPLNFFAQETSLDQIEKVSIGNVPDGSKMLWVHWIMTHFFSFYTLYLLYKNSKDQAYLRILYLQAQARKGCIHTRTIMVTHVPETLRHEQRLREYFDSLGAGSVDSVVFVRQVSKLTRKIKRRNATLEKIEECHIRLARDLIKKLRKKGIKAFGDMNVNAEKARNLSNIVTKILSIVDSKTRKHSHLPMINPASSSSNLWSLICQIDRTLLDQYQPKHGVGVFHTGPPVITIDYMLKKFNRLEQRVAELRSLTESASYYKPTGTAFVTFQTQVSAQLCAQSIISTDPESCNTKMAPEPRDLIWSNLTFNSQHKLLRSFLVNSSVWALTILWLFPSTYFVSFASYNQVSARLPWIQIIATKSPWIKNLIETMLPSILISLFMIAMPNIMLGLSSFDSFSSYSQLELASINRYYRFAIFNVLFVFLLGSAFIEVILAVIQSPASIIKVLADHIPKGAAFFINYVILQTCSHGLEILQVGAPLFHCYAFANSWISKTPRELQTHRKPWPFPYYYYLPTHILVLVICITYSIINPLILFFGTIYFGLALLVYKYQFAYAYIKNYEANGKIWKYIFQYISHGLVIFQLTMLGVISLKNSFISGLTLLPLLGCTIYFIYYCRSRYRDHTKYVPLDALYEREEAIERKCSHTLQASLVDSPDPIMESNAVTSSTSDDDKKQEISSPRNSRSTFTSDPTFPLISEISDSPANTSAKNAYKDKDNPSLKDSKEPEPNIAQASAPNHCKLYDDSGQLPSIGTYIPLSGNSFSCKYPEHDTKSQVKHKLAKIQQQIFSSPLLSLLWQLPVGHEASITHHADPKEIPSIPVLPNRETFQDDTNPFETYLHPDLIRPLPGCLWLPQNPLRHLYDLDTEMSDLDKAITSSVFVPATLGGGSSLGFGGLAIPTTRRNGTLRETSQTTSKFPFLFNSVRTGKSVASRSSYDVSKYQAGGSDISESVATTRSRPPSGLINLIRSITWKPVSDEIPSGSRSIIMAEFHDQLNDGPLSGCNSTVEEDDYSPRSSISSGKSA
ncbi:hypothetical protein K7432_010033 [Basidiobolus ranarum]|uniref:DUF221-domain-containing protein n=1 Tax=Basidiobolus ranarum TaxID=34480 RepID=A0ABR2VW49_9FUNG